ncbi:MAG: GC-type dockerin domain-anchored protein [Phycisphaerales bacterium]
MRIRVVTPAAILAALAGGAVAQPTVNGVFDPGTEGSFYSSVLWMQNQPTAFGDNEAGDFTGGDFGDPPGDVMTGVEIRIPLADIGGDGNFRLTGWVNSGDRTFMANQNIHDGNFPIDTGNLGNPPHDFSSAPFDAGNEYITVAAAAAASAPVIDGTLDAALYGSAKFLQTNYTGFGNDTSGTEIGGGGSEIDAVYACTNGGNLYLFIAGNLENNGNAIDLYFDTDSSGGTGSNTLGSGSGAGAFIINGQSGTIFDSGFGADFLVSVDDWNHDSDDGTTPNIPRLWSGPLSGSISDQGSTTGHGAAGAGSLMNGYALAIDNSNTAGVIGSPSLASPVAPDADWAYGSELDNVRAYLDVDEGPVVSGSLYIFIGGNMEVNYNKCSLFIDCAPGGQNVLRNDNVDISFNGLNRQSDLIWDEGFAPDFWLNVNNGVNGGSGNLENYTDATTLRTDGPIFDPFFGLLADVGGDFGGDVTDGQGNPVGSPVELINFSGPLFQEQDGFTAALYSNYAPRTSTETVLDILDGSLPSGSLPPAGLIQVAINNSNVAGVTAADAGSPSVAGAAAVNTGIEIRIDLAELGWDGVQDILLGGYITNGGFDYVSNQVLGGLPDSEAPAENLGEVHNIDFSAIEGNQYVNLSAPANPGCNPADLDVPYGTLDFSDVIAFLTAFGTMQPAADLAVPFGTFDFSDVIAFLTAFGNGCP